MPDGPTRFFTKAPSGKATIVRMTIHGRLSRAQLGVAVILETDNWVIGSAVPLR